jgi:F-box and leucine-rich repeat protein 1 (S-phase kinase-associated protein 2)
LVNNLQAIGRNCSQLQSLNLGWCENVSDVGVMSLAYGCPDIRTLDLCGCVCITGIFKFGDAFASFHKMFIHYYFTKMYLLVGYKAQNFTELSNGQET